jgi:hypothetical protein
MSKHNICLSKEGYSLIGEGFTPFLDLNATPENPRGVFTHMMPFS